MINKNNFEDRCNINEIWIVYEFIGYIDDE